MFTTYIEYWLWRNGEIHVAASKCRWVLPHIPEAVTGFLHMVFGVLMCQPKSLRPASYRPKTMNALLREVIVCRQSKYNQNDCKNRWY